MRKRKLLAIVATVAACAIGGLGAQAAQATPTEERAIWVVNTSKMGTPAFKEMFAALSLQIERDYNFSPWVKLGLAPKAHLVLGEAPAGAWKETLQDGPVGGGFGQDAGKHVLVEGVPAAVVSYPKAKFYSGGNHGVGEAMSHELLEMLVDPTVESYVTNEAGVSYLEEVADPMLGSYYEISGWRVADFALPAWFGIADGLEFPWYTFRFTVEAPFTLGPATGGVEPPPQAEWRCPGESGWNTQIAGEANPSCP